LEHLLVVHAELTVRLVDLLGHVLGAHAALEEAIDPAKDEVMLLYRNTEHGSDDAHRQARGEIADDLHPPAWKLRLDKFDGPLADARLLFTDVLRGEALRDNPALLPMLLAIFVNHRGIGRKIRAVSLGGGEGLRIAGNRDDVVVAKDVPDLIMRIPVQRLILTEILEHLPRIVVGLGIAHIDVFEDLGHGVALIPNARRIEQPAASWGLIGWRFEVI